MAKKHLKYILLEEGEFLYDKDTANIYTFNTPHRLVGKIEFKPKFHIKYVNFSNKSI